MKKVCIVGGGPAGLASLRRVVDSPTLTGKLFEQKNDIGGVWNYKGVKEFATSHRNISGDGIDGEVAPEMVTAMYDDLSCNLPCQFLELRDFSFDDDIKSKGSYPTQSDMYQYMRNYATHFNLWPNVYVNTAVVNIRPETPISNPGEPGRWIVQVHEHKEDAYSTEVFDAVIICTGKNCYPHRPAISGLETFTGKVMHSKYFKNAEQEGFKGKDIVCIGLGPSSADLLLLLSKTAKSVTVCHKFPYGFKLGIVPRNTREVENVKMVTKDGVITKADEVIPCDVIMLCTGYGLKFPFLDPECGITVVEGKYVPDLYNLTVFTKRPSLGILNMCYRTPEIFVSEIQARYFVSCLEGKTKLPSFQEMDSALAAHEEEMRKLGRSYSTWFELGVFGLESFPFFQKMAESIGLKEEYRHFPLMQQLWVTIVGRILGKTALFRNDVLKVIDQNTCELLLHHNPEYLESEPGKIKFTLNPDSTVTVEHLENDNNL